MDSRLQNLSFSSILQLHTCPRKWQLNRLQSRAEDVEDRFSPHVTFAFGHTVGAGVQLALTSRKTVELTPLVSARVSEVSLVDTILDRVPDTTIDIDLIGRDPTPRAKTISIELPEYETLSHEDATIWGMFLTWEIDLLERNDKQGKSFWNCVMAINKLFAIKDIILENYELVYYNGKPATELGFRITFPDGFKLRGFVDAVLRHKVTNKVIVLECKTTKATEVPPAQFKNSAQALGYSLVLDVLFPDLSSYDVLYLIYKTKMVDWLPMPFTKTYLQRALWIRELLLDIEIIKMYEDAGVYPMRGENCYNFGRDCEYINLCTMETSRLVKPLEVEKVEEYQIELTIDDVVRAQLEKV